VIRDIRLIEKGNRQRLVRPSDAGPMERKEAMITGNLDESSSGCETRPIKAEPGGSVASLAPMTVTAWAMRRHASV
jgi:hypothetical protein